MTHTLASRRAALAPFAAFAAAALVRGAGAQVFPRLDATIAAGGGDAALVGRIPVAAPAPLLSPGLRIETPRLAFAFGGDVAVTDAARLGGGRAHLLATRPLGTPFGRSLRGAFAAAAERDARTPGRLRWHGAATGQLALELGRGGVWAGGEVSRLTMPESLVPAACRDSSAGASAARPPAPPFAAHTEGRLAFGAWRTLGSIVTSVTVRGGTTRVPGRASTVRVVDRQPFVTWDTTLSRWDTSFVDVLAGDTASPGGARRVTDAEARVAWARGRVALAATAGVRLLNWGAGDVAAIPGRRVRATLDATVGLGRYAALVASVGDAGRGTADLPAALAGSAAPLVREGRHVALGVRLSPAVFARPALPPVVRPAASAFTLHAAGEGRWALRVRVPAARAVEVSGEFTGWKPVALRRVAADTWEAVLPLAAGAYRVSIRVDGGAWVAPPGLAAVEDDFGGSAGVVVVP